MYGWNYVIAGSWVVNSENWHLKLAITFFSTVGRATNSYHLPFCFVCMDTGSEWVCSNLLHLCRQMRVDHSPHSIRPRENVRLIHQRTCWKEIVHSILLGRSLYPMGDCSVHFCLLNTVIAFWRGIFWLKWQGNKLGLMAGKLNWLEWQGKKLVQKRPVGGTKCVKKTNNLNKGAWLFFPIDL